MTDKNPIHEKPPTIKPVKSSANLTQLFEQLNHEAQYTLLAFAEFLHGNEDNRISALDETVVPTEPLDIRRPDNESVIAAIKRLSKTYPMLDSESMLHETAHFMTEHIVKGREASTVIDDLEALFKNKFQIEKTER